MSRLKEIGWILLAPVGLAGFVLVGPFVAIGIVLWTILLALVGFFSYLLKDAVHDLRRFIRWMNENA